MECLCLIWTKIEFVINKNKCHWNSNMSITIFIYAINNPDNNSIKKNTMKINLSNFQIYLLYYEEEQ